LKGSEKTRVEEESQVKVKERERKKEKKEEKKEVREKKMAEEQVPIPKFSGSEDEFNVWLFWAEAYAEQFGFASAMGDAAEADLPEKEGPGTTNQEQAAAEHNWKAVSFNHVHHAKFFDGEPDGSK
jgi:hypothetical protein